MASEVKEEMKESCEMENSEVRFYDVRSSKGRLPFLNKVSCCDVYFSSSCFSFVQILPDVPEPPMQCTGLTPTQELRQPIWEKMAKRRKVERQKEVKNAFIRMSKNLN